MSDTGLAEKRIYHAALNGNNSLPNVLHQKVCFDNANSDSPSAYFTV
ncbi:hypothetical protein NC653_006384 [Populus alba x Populus x berolinensis]|uniref:Uncharacterized protein n=1 Tax=Populus alba x Populus x berolinensis TaxID=444605 RepID=A0AAD6REE4_9ROSI|nr:hypothetical protein NC653_006384 [Populus alba x Populus x berolinensis]